MNLLDEAWIPIKRKDGTQDWITPYQLTEPDIVALDSRRPDFNGALIQFLIGLIQTTTPMDSHTTWQEWYERPPSEQTLGEWFKPIHKAFTFDGDGARFMQDFTLRTEGAAAKEFNGIGTLLIESPGENTLAKNADFFIKRNFIQALCPHCTATAIFTIQINAPAGGRGILTSIRGGGPLTTLIYKNTNRSIWHMIWMNVRERTQFLSLSGNASKSDLNFIFPWLDDISKIQVSGGKTTPMQTHPAHVFWGMPRRIRIDFENCSEGKCYICAKFSNKLVSRFITKPKGFDYNGAWIHPLSPYYGKTGEELLPFHPQPDGIGYKHWLGWILGISSTNQKIQPASIVTHVLNSQRIENGQFGLWAFGYDMDNMKARCWYESTLPLYGLTERNEEGRQLVQKEVSKFLEAADYTLSLLRTAVRSAYFSQKDDVKGDWGFVNTIFWERTESDFYKLINDLIEYARDENESSLRPMREQWYRNLLKAAKNIFNNDVVGAAQIERENPKRIATAYNKLFKDLEGKKLKSILKLDLPLVKAKAK
ncbi:MAG: type I-E CRISPR-associated protein Cse1/CasA [Gammaproteobacteria bacterium]|jgi:CRISPR system Cascade subunit CasA|nr:type I-E CRISPR-associated protein Cse1/CasA [Gammaproteobacteria bacterium]